MTGRQTRHPQLAWRGRQIAAMWDVAALLLLGTLTALMARPRPWAVPALTLGAVVLLLSLHARVQALSRRLAAAQLEDQSFHDPLTGLPNRALLRDRIAHALARKHCAVAVLHLDLDNFKVVNDSLGHSTGDRLLVAVARRLQALVRAEDTVARQGDDEFTILLEEAEDVTEAVRIAECLLGEVRIPFQIDSQELVVTSSVGITHSLSGGDPDDLLRQADMALYQAKAEGKTGYALSDPAMAARAAHRLSLEHDLRRALERGQLSVFYQPRVIPGSGRLAGLEALMRWTHPHLGSIVPSAFIPLAEETGLILPLGEWVLTEACRQAQEWQRRYPPIAPLHVGVNLSFRQFRHPDLVGSITRALRGSGLPATCLELELTESTAMEDVDVTIAILDRLKELGVRLALDDFGTGYSNLHALRRLPLDTLKVDRSLVTEIAQDRRARGVLQAVVTLGRTLGLQLVAEGVETADQLVTLRSMGCDLCQGFYFAGPLSQEAVERILARGGLRPEGEAVREQERGRQQAG